MRKASDSDCLDFVRAYVVLHGYAPSVREIANGVGLVSLSAVSAHLRKLEKKGLIRREKGLSRAIQLLPYGIVKA